MSVPPTQKANGDDLPFKLVEDIIENIRDDVASLHISSFVSKAWHAASLRHLFSVAHFSLEIFFSPTGATSAHQWSLSMSKTNTTHSSSQGIHSPPRHGGRFLGGHVPPASFT
ncbi:hypothetical protein DFS33DRAFT_1379045 [Desarmillaria ectypa]|nr:hypothetical protein DFS33DRAFT_1379045 [Desarmillaria ectypa]